MTIEVLGSQRPRYRWIPLLYVAAMLLVVCVNAALVYFAIREPVGMVAASPYEKGLHFNAELAQRARQDALGWQVAVGYFAKTAGTGEIAIELRDSAGKPLAGLQPRIRLSRPIEVVAPIEVVLNDRGNGRYSAIVAPPRRGQWDLAVDVAGPMQFNAVHRIVVP
jgi:nitrogen fixation protein FixH